MNRLLEKQVKKSTDPATGAMDASRLVDLVSKTYDDYERMRAIESRAMQLMSDELNAANAAIRRESEEKISESQRRFEIAVNGTQDGIWDWNVRDDKIWFSKRALSMLGYAEGAFADAGMKTWLDLVAADDHENARRFIDDCCKGGGHPVVTLSFREKTGGTRHILCRASGMQDSAGKVARVVGVHTDLTDLIAMQEELRRSRDRAEAANRAKSEFLANMTHELRTPLNSIITLSRMVQDAPSEAERRQFMEVIQVSSEMLLGIVSDILDFSKIEANEMRLEHIGFDLVSAIGKALVPVRHMASGKGLEFSISFDSQGPIPCVKGDPLRLAQVLTNLATNAVKYTEKGAVTVTVKVTPDDVDDTAGIEIAIRDTGIGIPPDRQKTIFEKFTQADTSTTRRFGGTGLGLAISSRIVDLMGGTISIDSTEGKGSVFTVALRLQRTAQPEIDIKVPHDAAQGAGQGMMPVSDARILVVEDHPMNRIVAEKVLQKFGFKHIAQAENGAIALSMLADKPYDAILMDCFMPEMDGYEATRRIRAGEAGTGRHIPIIAVTANAAAEDKQRCLDCGMDHYTVKPIIERELKRILSAYVRFSGADDTGGVQKQAQAGGVDIAVLQGYSNGDASTEQALVDAFLAQSDLNITQMRAALEAMDDEKWRRAAHTLKGGSRSIGAAFLGELGAQAQSISDIADGKTAKALLASIEQEFTKVDKALRSYIAERK